MEDISFSFNNDTNTEKQSSLLNGTTTMEFEQDRQQPAKIKVIGVGGGGGNAVNHMFRQGIKGVDFIVCNTDAKALSASPVPNKIELGKLGAGNVPERARKAALEHKDLIREAISDDTQMLFITAGMGGGTGTGAAPVIAEIAKSIELDDEMVPRILVVAIVTMPFSFEGPIRRRQALQGIEELRKQVDAIIIINNDKLRDICGNVPFNVAFSQADDVLLTAAKGIAEIITVSGYVNIDFRDVNTVMEKSGTALMGAGEGRGENRARQAIEAATTSVLLNDNDIRGAKNILLYLSYSPTNQMTMDEIGEVTDYLTKLIGDNEANIIWGNADDDSLDDELRITLIATGFEQRPGPKTIDLGAEMRKKQEEEERKRQEEEARKQAEAAAQAAAAQAAVNEVTDDSGMKIIHRLEPTTTDATTPAQPTPSDNPFDNMVTNRIGEKRIITLDMPAEEVAEEVEATAGVSRETVELTAPQPHSHLDDIRVINKDIVQQSKPAPAQTVATEGSNSLNKVQTVATEGSNSLNKAQTVATEGSSGLNKVQTAETEGSNSLRMSTPVFHIEQTEALESADNRQKPSESFADRQASEAFMPKEDFGDQQLKLKAERIRRMNDLLRNNPEGPSQIEKMTIEELTGESYFPENHSTESETSRYAFGRDGSIAMNFHALNDLPD